MMVLFADDDIRVVFSASDLEIFALFHVCFRGDCCSRGEP